MIIAKIYHFITNTTVRGDYGIFIFPVSHTGFFYLPRFTYGDFIFPVSHTGNFNFSPFHIRGFFPAGLTKFVFQGWDMDWSICFYIIILPKGNLLWYLKICYSCGVFKKPRIIRGYFPRGLPAGRPFGRGVFHFPRGYAIFNFDFFALLKYQELWYYQF